MFNNLGIQWAGTLVGCLATVCVPIPVLFYFYGRKLREKSNFAPTFPVKDREEMSESEVEADERDVHDVTMGSRNAASTRSGRSRRRSSGARSLGATAATANGADLEKAGSWRNGDTREDGLAKTKS